MLYRSPACCLVAFSHALMLQRSAWQLRSLILIPAALMFAQKTRLAALVSCLAAAAVSCSPARCSGDSLHMTVNEMKSMPFLPAGKARLLMCKMLLAMPHLDCEPQHKCSTRVVQSHTQHISPNFGCLENTAARGRVAKGMHRTWCSDAGLQGSPLHANVLFGHLPVHCERSIVCILPEKLRQGCNSGVCDHKELVHVYEGHPLVLCSACHRAFMLFLS